MIIGKLKGNKVELGATVNGFVYKNTEAFKSKSNEICYIPEYGVDDDFITDESDVYRYSDFFDLALLYKIESGSESSLEDIASLIFDSVDWQSPSTLVDEWLMNDDD